MKYKKPSRADLRQSCDQVGPGDGDDPRFDFRPTADARVTRKSLQLCHEVARVLGQVLLWETGDDVLAELVVESVLPAPSTARLRVVMSAPPDAVLEDVLAALQARAGRLRAEVAASVRRRRAPELVFQVVPRRA
jgi:ribosome-binding factor A